MTIPQPVGFCGDNRTLRSVSWDGDAPDVGDVVLDGQNVYVVEAVAAGAGVGQYRLDVRASRLIVWRAS